MANILHITNGDSAGELIKASQQLDFILPMRDVLEEGPCPQVESMEAFIQVRAKFLSDRHWTTYENALQSFQTRQAQLEAFKDYDSILLWFEHDLHDQLQILQCLDWFNNQDLEEIPIHLICINQFPGIEPFRGIGQLAVEQIPDLLSQQIPVTADMLAIASEGWAAYCSPNPREIETFISKNYALGFVTPALQRHLEEFPWIETGLSRTEQQLLSLIADGIDDPVDLFKANMNQEQWLYFGDWSIWFMLQTLSSGETPLIAVTGAESFHPAQQMESIPQFRLQKLSITSQGQSALAGELGNVQRFGQSIWRGGVELGGNRLDVSRKRLNQRRWNPQTKKLVDCSPNGS